MLTLSMYNLTQFNFQFQFFFIMISINFELMDEPVQI